MRWTLRKSKPTCTGHHWHVARRGWRCCHCPATVSHRNAAPDHEADCAQPLSPLDELLGWLEDVQHGDGDPAAQRLAPPAAAGERRRLRRASA